ncbi:MAG TPA: dihydrofolate reductase family protein [Polyangiaceae bacterium]|jgi:riboflavin-specific deaminase-like protein
MSRPRVLVNFAPSLDGKIAPAHKTRPFVMSREQEDPKRMKALRERADAVIIGASNLRADDPDLAPARLRVVVTRAGDGVRPEARMFDETPGGEAVVAHTAHMTRETRAALGARATLLELGTTQVDVAGLLGWLASERGCSVVLCEGGGVLTAQLFAAHAVDELYLTLVPRILGGSSAPTMVEGDGFAPDTIPFARLVQHERVGDELYLVYAFDWPATPAQ